MSAWLVSWHRYAVPLAVQRLRKVIVGHCILLAWRLMPAYALRLMRNLALEEANTSPQPIVLRPHQVTQTTIAGLRPFAVRLGYSLRPSVDILQGRAVALRVGRVALELEYQAPGWEDRCAVEIARAALYLGADRIDDALFALAGMQREAAAAAATGESQPLAQEPEPWPTNEPPQMSA